MDRDYSDPATVASALEEWDEVFRKLPRLDAVFVPGGDPGHTQPGSSCRSWPRSPRSCIGQPSPGHAVGLAAELQPGLARRVSGDPQDARAPWLGGVVHGPQVRISMAELRKAVPPRYPIRTYPDITHSQQCQYPVPDWDVAFSLTEGREVINPRPRARRRSSAITSPARSASSPIPRAATTTSTRSSGAAWAGTPTPTSSTSCASTAAPSSARRSPTSSPRGCLRSSGTGAGRLLTNASVEKTLASSRTCERSGDPRAPGQLAVPAGPLPGLLRRLCPQAADRRDRGSRRKHTRHLSRARAQGSLEAIKAIESVLDRSRLHFDHRP